MLLLIIINFLLVVSQIHQTSSQSSSNMIVVRNSLHEELPQETPKPVIINTLIFDQDISGINLVNEEYRVDYSTEFHWTFNAIYCRKSLDKYKGQELNESKEIFMTGTNFDQTIWVPDLIPESVKKNEIITNPIISLNITNEICYLKLIKRQSSTAGCKLDFRSYPFDAQICRFAMRSRNYPSNEVQFKWMAPNLVNSSEQLRANYKLTYFSSEYNKSAANGVIYSYLMVTYLFERHLSTFCVQTVYPTVLIVLIAYCSFWIPVDSGPGRFLLCILTFLALVTSFSGLKGQLPPVSYVIAVDIWYMVCMFFVFSAIVELTFVNYFHKKRNLILENNKEERKRLIFNKITVNQNCNETQFPGDRISNVDKETPFLRLVSCNRNDNNYQLDHKILSDKASIVDPPNRALQIDLAFRVIYPLCFVIYLTVFWPLLLTRNILQ